MYVLVEEALGTSPRVRVIGRDIGVAKAPDGYIPACAGNRYETALEISRKRVHPRVCG